MTSFDFARTKLALFTILKSRPSGVGNSKKGRKRERGGREREGVKSGECQRGKKEPVSLVVEEESEEYMALGTP